MSLPRPAEGTPPTEPRIGFGTMYVSRQVLAEGGPAMRREIRRHIRRALEDLTEPTEATIRLTRFRFNPFERDGDMDAPMAGGDALVLKVTAEIR